MVVGRAERRAKRSERVATVFGAADAEAVLDVLELLEFAWHDCYAEITPPDDVIDDVLLVSRGTLLGLVSAARLAVTDSRDLRLAADALRGGAAQQ